MRTKTKRDDVATTDDRGQPGTPPQGHAQVGQLVAVDERGFAWIDFGDGKQPKAAVVAFTATRDQLEHVMSVKAPVVVYGDVNGLQVVAVVGVALSSPTSPQAATQSPAIEADVDGQRIRLSGEKEVVIACGKSSITLRANGRVIIKGMQIESYSEGTNRIKGGQVRIN